MRDGGSAVRYAIFGDIHGNSEALGAVLGDVERMRVDRLLCLGDIVGYGAEPEACIRRIRSLGIGCILGNHDSAATGGTPLDYFNPYARAAVEWTADRLGGDEKAWLASLPLTMPLGGFILVHATLDRPAEWGYIMDREAAARCFDLLGERACFIGHSHVPVTFRRDGGISTICDVATVLDEGARYIINVGSVGQPRDGDPRASYGILDEGAGRVEIRRVAYDVGRAGRKILDAGLPPFLALRLEAGR
ncbi:MAG: metallophosphoesterase family protein [bacterium]|nr:metallophosphoesterase family protein [bacterium]